MDVNEKLDLYARKLQQGHLSISEAELMIDEAIHEDCAELIEDMGAWIKRYYTLKRRAWHLLLKVTARTR